MRKDITNAEQIFGPDVGSLKGKTVRRNGKHVRADPVELPVDLVRQYRDVTLGADILFLNKIAFFVTMSRKIKFGTVEMIQSQDMKTIHTAIKHVTQVYAQRGFRVTNILMDGQFEPLRGDLAEMGILLNPTANDAHVPEAERRIRTIKERVRCIYNTLPFKRLPGRIIIEMVYHANFWLNCFPANDGISDTLSPRAIVCGSQLDYNKHCRLEFGTYVQSHEEHDNSMQSRTIGAIAMRPTGNDQGSYYLFSLSTGRILRRDRWTILPMPDDVIERVRHVLARRSPAGLTAGLHFANRHGVPLVDDDDDDPDDEDYTPDDDDNDDDSDDSGDDDNHDDESDGASEAGLPIAGVNDPNDPVLDENENENDNDEEEHDNEPEQSDHGDDRSDSDNEETATNDEEVDDEPINNHALDYLEREMDERYGERTGRYDLRPRRERNYDHLHATIHETALSQVNMKKGLKIFGDAGVEAVMAELTQLHERGVIQPKEAGKLSDDDRRKALEYLMFLKKKRNGKIKGRGCADGRKQRAYTQKDSVSSPTVSIESVMITSVIEAAEGRDVATVDSPGAFLQADMDEVVHMRLEGKMAEMLTRVDEKIYKKYVKAGDENISIPYTSVD